MFLFSKNVLPVSTKSTILSLALAVAYACNPIQCMSCDATGGTTAGKENKLVIMFNHRKSQNFNVYTSNATLSIFMSPEGSNNTTLCQSSKYNSQLLPLLKIMELWQICSLTLNHTQQTMCSEKIHVAVTFSNFYFLSSNVDEPQNCSKGNTL